MTRVELTGVRDLGFSGWVRQNLPDSSTGFIVSDLDFIIENYKTKNIMLLEIKTRNCELKEWQRRLFNNLDRWIENGIDDGWTYHGFHTIKFEHTFFNDGKVYFDNVEMTEQQILDILSFSKYNRYAKNS